MLLRSERQLFSLETAVKVARIMRRAGLVNATPQQYSNGCVIAASYVDSRGVRCSVFPGNFRGARRVIARFKRDAEEGGDGQQR